MEICVRQFKKNIKEFVSINLFLNWII